MNPRDQNTPTAPNPHKRYTGLARVLRASGHSVAGLRAAYQGESAFRQEFWLAAVLIPAAFWVGRDAWHIALLVAATLLVLIVELLNSAVEAVVDRISLELHPLSKLAKDYGSAAVALALLACAALWAAALWQRFA
jgi:diacylglycerol kinase (ATP)